MDEQKTEQQSSGITSLSIKNFQGHKATKLSFVPGINVVTGSSDSGKSSVIRALLWGLTNKPGGFGFKSFFAGDRESVETEIEIDNRTILRKKTASINQYKLDDETYSAIGSGVPEDIETVLGLSEHNLQTQFSPYFLFQDSGGEVGRKLNHVCDLTDIDVVLTRASQRVNRLKKDEDYHQEKVASISKELIPFEILDDLRPSIANIERLETEIGETKSIAEKLLSLTTNIERLEDDLSKASDKAEHLESEVNALRKQLTRYIQERKECNELSALVEAIKRIDVDVHKELICAEESVLGIITSASKIAQGRSDLNSDITFIRMYQKASCDILVSDTEFEKAQKEYDSFHASIKICPLCGREN